jgi:hypothetical protein
VSGDETANDGSAVGGILSTEHGSEKTWGTTPAVGKSSEGDNPGMEVAGV